MQNDYILNYSVPEIHPPLPNIKIDAAKVYTSVNTNFESKIN